MNELIEIEIAHKVGTLTNLIMSPTLLMEGKEVDRRNGVRCIFHGQGSQREMGGKKMNTELSVQGMGHAEFQGTVGAPETRNVALEAAATLLTIRAASGEQEMAIKELIGKAVAAMAEADRENLDKLSKEITADGFGLPPEVASVVSGYTKNYVLASILTEKAG